MQEIIPAAMLLLSEIMLGNRLYPICYSHFAYSTKKIFFDIKAVIQAIDLPLSTTEVKGCFGQTIIGEDPCLDFKLLVVVSLICMTSTQICDGEQH